MSRQAFEHISVGSCLLFLVALLFVLGPAQPAAARPTAASAAPAAEIEPGWQAAAQEQIRQSEYQLSWQESSQVSGLGAAFQAPNRAHNLRTYFTPEGITVTPRTCGEAACAAPLWQWELQLAGYGRGDQLKALPAGGQPQVEGNRATYNYPGNKIQMWYVNDERGLEQGFTLAARPDGDGPLWVSLRYSGDLQPALSADGQAMAWTTSGGVQVLRYDSLQATDADGRTLPARLEVEAGSAAIRLVVDDAGAVYPLTIDALSTTPDWTAESDQAGAEFGVSVSGAGDVNGDGYADVIVGADRYDNGQIDEGRAYVYLGSAAGLSATPAWTAEGDQSYALFGNSVSGAGDVNDDGYDDVIVGAVWYDNGQDSEGRAYVYHGSMAGLSVTPTWIAESDQVGALFGQSVSVAGDVNGDGYDDVIVGAFYYSNGQDGEGRAYVYYGSAAGLSVAPAWTAESDQAYAEFGSSVSGAGDVNGDGYDEVVVGAYRYGNGQMEEGRAYVYHGSAAGLSATPDWTAESDQGMAWFGFSVSGAGDVNGDGYDEVVVGAPGYDKGQENEGRIYIYHGSAAGLSVIPDWTAESDQAYATLGMVSGAGDVNGDGYDDVIAGAYQYDHGQQDEGRAFVYLGSAAGLNTTPDWMAESNQASTLFGWSVSGAGDVNGDGYGDVIVGASYYDNGQMDEGRAFVYHGGPDPAAIEVSKTVGTDPAVCATSDMLTVWEGTVVYYCYSVTNTGIITLPMHDLVDDQLGAIFTGLAYNLAPGASVDTVAAGLTISLTAVADVTNTATWTAYDNAGLSATATDSATVMVTPINAAITLVKTVGTDAATCALTTNIQVDAGDTVYYCYTVTNTGNYTLPLHDLVDDQLGVIFSGLAYDLATGASVDTVAAGLTISASIWVDTTNTATWTAYDQAGAAATGTATATVTVTPTDVALARFGGAARPGWQPIVAALAVLTAPVIFILRRRRAGA